MTEREKWVEFETTGYKGEPTPEGPPEPDADLTMHNLDAVLVHREAQKDKQFWKRFRRRAAKTALGLILGGGAGGAAVNKWVPDAPEAVTQEDATKAKRERMSNKIQIDKLGVEVVKTQDAQRVTPDYIIEAVRAEDEAALAKVKKNKPEALRVLDRDQEEKEQAAKKGEMLKVTDEELDAALEEAEG